METLLGRAVTAFAYPYGAVDADSVDVVRAAGYRVAVTCEAEAVKPPCDPLRLPRFEVRARAFEAFVRTVERAIAPR